MKNYSKSIQAGFALLLISATAYAQSGKETLKLQNGDEYKKVTSMSSAVSMTQGSKKMDYTTRSTVTKSYQVTAADAQGYAITVTTKKVADTIENGGNKLQYSTDRPADTASAVERGLKQMTLLPAQVNVDKSGKITQLDEVTKKFFDADLYSYTGVYAKRLVTGNNFTLGANFSIPATAKKGSSWKESKKEGKAKIETTYTIKEVNDKQTTVTFVSAITEPGTNSNLNGLFVLENATGVIAQRIIKTNTVGKITKNGTEISAARKDVISEVCYKVK